MAQTTAQNSKTLRAGSVKVEAGADIGSLINLGAFRGNVTFEEAWEEVTAMSANAGELARRIRNHRCSVAGDAFEVNPANLNMLRGGIDTYAAQAAASVNITDEAIILTGTVAKRLRYKQAAAGTECASIVVTGAGGTPTYVRNTDYVITVDAEGYTCIARVAGGTIADGATVMVDYQYTPAANVTLKSGGKVVIAPKVVRLTNVDENGKRFMITIYKAYNSQGIRLEFLEDESGEFTVIPLRFEGTKDVSRAAGDQLFEILDEQGV